VQGGDQAGAQRVFDGMVAAGVEPNEIAWGTLLNAYVQGGDQAGAQRVFDGMVAAGVEPNDIAWGTLLKAYAQGGDQVGAQRVFDSFVLLGREPNDIIWNTLLNAYAQAGDADGAERVLANMDGSLTVPDRISLSTVLNAYANAMDLPGCERVLERMEDDGIGLDPVVVATLIKCLGSLRDPDAAEAAMVSARFAPFSEDPLVLAGVARAYALAWRRPERLDRFRIADSGNSSGCAFWASVALSRGGSPEKALSFLDEYGSRSTQTLAIRCSIAAKASEKQLDSSLRIFFDVLNPSEEQLRVAYQRAVVSDAVSRGPQDVEKLSRRVGDLYDEQLKTGGRGQPIFRRLVKQSAKPWFTLVCSFAQHFSFVAASELFLLFDDPDERRAATNRFTIARRWET
jgi:pentatricopeptide repeat protein